MPANTPVAQAIGGTADKGAIALLGLLWALTNNLTSTYKCLSGQTMADVGRYPEINAWKKNTGFYPAMLNFLTNGQGQTPSPFGVMVNAYTSYLGIDGMTVVETMIAHAQQGGVLTWETISDQVPCAYISGSTMNHAAQTIAQLNTAGTIVLTTATDTVFVTTGGTGVILATDGGGNNHLHTFTYTSRVTTTLHGVVIDPNTATGGATTDSVANGAFVGPATLALASNGLTSGAASGAFPLQYSSTAYQALGGTLAGATFSPASKTVTLTGTSTSTMPLVPGMFVTDAGANLGVGNTVASITDPTHFVLTNSPTGTVSTAETLTFTLGASTDYNAAQAFNSNDNLNKMLDNLIVGINMLGAVDIPVLFRPLSEVDASFFWWGNQATSGTPCMWSAQLFAYIVGYMTGVQVFAGQPVSSTPLSNCIFGINLQASAGGQNGWLPQYAPVLNGVSYVDVLSCDCFSGPFQNIGTPAPGTGPPAGATASVGYALFDSLNNGTAGASPSLPAWAANLPQGVGEFFGDANQMPSQGMFFSPSVLKDLSTLSQLQGRGYAGSGFAGGRYAGTNAATVSTLNNGGTALAPAGTLALSKTPLSCNLSSIGGSGFIQCDDGMHAVTWAGISGSTLTGAFISGSTTAKVYTNNIICASGTAGVYTTNGFQQISYNYYTMGQPLFGCTYSTSSAVVQLPPGGVAAAGIVAGSSSVGSYGFGPGIPTSTFVQSIGPGTDQITLSATPTIASPSGPGALLQFAANGTTIASTSLILNVTSTAGVPTGSTIIDPSDVGGNFSLGWAQLIAVLPSNTGNAGCLAGLKTTNAAFINMWTSQGAGGSFNQLTQNPTTFSTWMNDPWMVNMEQMPAAAAALGCTLPWAKALGSGTTSPLGAKGMPAMAAMASAIR